MFAKKFNTQIEATEFYGHSWAWIEKHYLVRYCYDRSGWRGYYISKN